MLFERQVWRWNVLSSSGSSDYSLFAEHERRANGWESVRFRIFRTSGELASTGSLHPGSFVRTVARRGRKILQHARTPRSLRAFLLRSSRNASISKQKFECLRHPATVPSMFTVGFHVIAMRNSFLNHQLMNSCSSQRS